MVRFGPKGKTHGFVKIIEIDLNELEMLYQVDLKECKLEEAAGEMEVSIKEARQYLKNVRKKMALALVYGFEIHIRGGNHIITFGKY